MSRRGTTEFLLRVGRREPAGRRSKPTAMVATGRSEGLDCASTDAHAMASYCWRFTDPLASSAVSTGGQVSIWRHGGSGAPSFRHSIAYGESPSSPKSSASGRRLRSRRTVGYSLNRRTRMSPKEQTKTSSPPAHSGRPTGRSTSESHVRCPSPTTMPGFLRPAGHERSLIRRVAWPLATRAAVRDRPGSERRDGWFRRTIEAPWPVQMCHLPGR